MPSRPRRVLDLGCGTGDLTLGLLAFVDAIDAVDPSEAMLEVGRARPGGRDRRINWIQSTAEDFHFAGPYSLIVAGESLHWMDWEIVLAKCADALQGGAYLGLVDGRHFVDVPWGAELQALIPRYSTNQDYQPVDLVAELKQRRLFREVGRKTSRSAYSQTVDDYIESCHTRNGFSRERMDPVAAAAFDRAVAELMIPCAPSGVYRGVIQSEVVWGEPSMP